MTLFFRMGMKQNIEMEVIDCPLCGERKSSPLHREHPFQMVRCSSCQFVFANPRPTEEFLFRYYQHYLPENDASIKAWHKMMKPVFQKAARLIGQYQKRGKLLDAGSGFGFFLSEMRERGWEVIGVDLSQKAIDYARHHLGLTIHPGPLERVGFRENEFDVVSGFYVVEHLSNPVAFLKECYRVLKPGGILLLRYPHTTPIKNLLRFFRIENRLYDQPAHLSDFSPETIERSLRRAGFSRFRHLIGGYTFPKELGKRWASSLFGNLSEALFRLSRKHFLLPGVSKTILAFKENPS